MLPLVIQGTLSWWDAPHYAVASISTDHITQKQNDYITFVMNTWESEPMTLVGASTWHDNIKGAGVAVMLNWHFRNQAVFIPSTFKTDFPTMFNVTDVNRDCINSIMDKTTTSLWALGFCFRSLSHFVGDAHCPVHAVGRWTPSTPEGDRGATRTKLKNCPYGDPCNNLHMMWDSAVLDFQLYDKKNMKDLDENITVLKKAYDAEKIWGVEHAKSINPEDWENDAYQIGKDYAYGKLGENDTVTEEYIKEGAVAAKKLISVGGYRLGTILKKFFDTRGNNLPGMNSGKQDNTRAIILWVINSVLFVVSCVYAFLILRTKPLYPLALNA